MTDADRKPFARTLAALAAAYDMEVDEAVAEGFWMTLCDLPLELVQAAVLEVMRTSKFRPKAAEIRELVVKEQAAAQRIAHRERQITLAYATATASRIIRKLREQGYPDDAIRNQLALESERLGLTLYWPGEEPDEERGLIRTA